MSRAPERTRFLAERLVELWLPAFELKGFREVECRLQKKDSPLGGRELSLERWGEVYVDSVHLWFDKYDSPRFQVSFDRRLGSDTDQRLRGGNLVKRRREYYHEWGKPRWVPLGLWRERHARACVAAVVRASPQILEFLETGERGLNINRAVRFRAPSPR